MEKEMNYQAFEDYYNKNLLRHLEGLENKRAEVIKTTVPLDVLAVVTFFAMIYFFMMFQSQIVIWISIIVIFLLEAFSWRKRGEFSESFKNSVLDKILALFGNIYRSTSSPIKLADIRQFGLYDEATHQRSDDKFVGIYKECNYAIAEVEFFHKEYYYDSKGRRQSIEETDFQGLALKIQMKKPFQGQTVIASKNNVVNPGGMQSVELESNIFMRGRKVYSTDQIEARYILTPTFMEKIMGIQGQFKNALNKHKNKYNNSAKVQTLQKITPSTDTSVGFSEGFVYIFIPSRIDFFEFSIWSTLLNPDKYYTVYSQINAILSLIDYLEADNKTGL